MTTAVKHITAMLESAYTWLYDTEQPDGALLQHHGVEVMFTDTRRVEVVPRGYDGCPVLVVTVSNPQHPHPTSWECSNPLGGVEERQVWENVVDEVGRRWDTAVQAMWNWTSPNGNGIITGSFGLSRPAGSSLLAAVDRYQDGCSRHPAVEGQQNSARGVFCDCTWYSIGRALVVDPERNPLTHPPAAQEVRRARDVRPVTAPLNACDRARAGDFSGTVPVILTDGRRLGYVFPAPVPPITRAGSPDRDQWTFATPAGFVSSVASRSRNAAVLALATHQGVTNYGALDWHDLDLMGVLHGLTERYTARAIAKAALVYAGAHADPDVIEDRRETGTVDRELLRQVIGSTIGPTTAAEVLADYDVVAPEPAPAAVAAEVPVPVPK